MYVPEAFAETRLTVLHDAIEASGLAIFVTAANGEPTATHLPMLLARDEGPFGTLHFHLARANPQWQAPRRRGAGNLSRPRRLRLALRLSLEGGNTAAWCRPGTTSRCTPPAARNSTTSPTGCSPW
ncbi:MAG: FMN-binding negative transcriptional regulator [Rhodospirillales bacterium]